MVPDDPQHRRAWIKYQLALRGYTLSKLARELGLSVHAPKLVFKRPYPRIEQAIAATLGLPPQALWPERYDAQGQPRRRRRLLPNGTERSIPHGTRNAREKGRPRLGGGGPAAEATWGKPA